MHNTGRSFSRMIDRLIREIKAVGKYEGLVSPKELYDIREKVNSGLSAVEIYGDSAAQRLQEWIKEKCNDLAARRLRHEDMLYLGGELYRVLAPYSLQKKETDHYLKTLSECTDRRHGKRMLRQWVAELADHTRHEAEPAITQTKAERSRVSREETADLRVHNLENRALQTTSEAAQALYVAGLTASTRHEKIRLFKAAIREDSRDGGDGEATSATNHEPEEMKPDCEIRYHNLHDLVTKRLKATVHPVFNGSTLMCGEIIRALAQFGNPGGFFGVSYLALNSLKKLVRRQYKTRLGRKPFDPAEFMAVVRTLLLLNILLEPKEKEHDRMISLSSHVHEATTPEAGRIIAAVLALKRETSNGATDNNAG